MSAFDNSDYKEVPERIREFREKHPEGSLQPVDPMRPYSIERIGEQVFIVYAAAAYRDKHDARPGIGTAWEPFPGKTNFTRDSELQNAETSAWGRAIVAALASDSKHVASAEEVRRREPEPTIGKYKTAQFIARLDSFGRYPQEWIDAGLPPRPKMETLPVSRIEEAEQILDAAEERATAERLRELDAAEANRVRETAVTAAVPQHEAAEGVAAAVAAGTATTRSNEGAAVSRTRGAKR